MLWPRCSCPEQCADGLGRSDSFSFRRPHDRPLGNWKLGCINPGKVAGRVSMSSSYVLYLGVAADVETDGPPMLPVDDVTWRGFEAMAIIENLVSFSIMS